MPVGLSNVVRRNFVEHAVPADRWQAIESPPVDLKGLARQAVLEAITRACLTTNEWDRCTKALGV